MVEEIEKLERRIKKWDRLYKSFMIVVGVALSGGLINFALTTSTEKSLYNLYSNRPSIVKRHEADIMAIKSLEYAEAMDNSLKIDRTNLERNVSRIIEDKEFKDYERQYREYGRDLERKREVGRKYIFPSFFTGVFGGLITALVALRKTESLEMEKENLKKGVIKD